MTRDKRCHILASVCLAFVLGVVAWGQTGAASAGPSSLTISAGDGKTEYLPLLPVVVTIELNNQGETSESIADGGLIVAEPGHWQRRERYRFEIRNPDLTTQPAYLSDWAYWFIDSEPMVPQGLQLGPRRKQILDYCLGFGLGVPATEWKDDLRKQATALFRKTGEFEIRLRIARLTAGPLESNPLAIKVVEPMNPSDLRAYEVLSHSRWPAMFLTPLYQGTEPSGVAVFTGPPLDVPATSSPLATCTQIVTLCPDSAYTPYARLFLASALARGWAECLAAGQGGQPLDVDKRMEGIRLLGQAAADSALPRRYREQGLLNLLRGANDVTNHIQWEAYKKLPTLESVVGARVDIGGLPEDTVFQIARDIAKGRSPSPGYDELLRAKLTPEQYQKLLNVAMSEGNIATRSGDGAILKELQELVAWARAQLRKIPWRDPDTGQLRMSGVSLSAK